MKEYDCVDPQRLYAQHQQNSPLHYVTTTALLDPYYVQTMGAVRLPGERSKMLAIVCFQSKDTRHRCMLVEDKVRCH